MACPMPLSARRNALRNLISEKKLVVEWMIKNALTGRLESQL